MNAYPSYSELVRELRSPQASFARKQIELATRFTYCCYSLVRTFTPTLLLSASTRSQWLVAANGGKFDFPVRSFLLLKEAATHLQCFGETAYPFIRPRNLAREEGRVDPVYVDKSAHTESLHRKCSSRKRLLRLMMEVSVTSNV